MDFVLCHVPKTGGTSVTEVLSTFFGPENTYIQPFPGDNTFIEPIYISSSAHRLFSGHLTLPDIKNIYTSVHDVAIIICIREPVQHFCSLYLHAKIFGTETEPERRALPLRDFLRENGNYYFDCSVLNVLTRYLCGKSIGTLDKHDYRLALINSRYIDFYFVTEQLSDSIGLFQKKYNIFLNKNISELNTNYLSVAFANSMYKYIYDLAPAIKYDVRLYNFIRNKQHKHIDLVSTSNKSAMTSGRTNKSTLYLAEYMRRSVYIYAGPPEFFEFRNNDILLHAITGERNRVRFVLELKRNISQCMFRLHLNPLCPRSVYFTIRFKNIDVECEYRYLVTTNKNLEVVNNIDCNVGKVEIEMDVMMQEIGDSNHYAMLFIEDLCLT